MSNTVITNYTDLNGPSTKADSSVVVIVNKDGSLSVDQNLLGTLMGTDGSQGAGISVVRVGHEGRPDDATDSESDDDKVPHVTLSVDSYYDEPSSIIKYDSGAEMLQSLRIETRENSLVGFQNDHCYTPLISPTQGVPQRSDSFSGYDEPVIEITHTPPPKPMPQSKKITILEQQIIPKGRKIIINPTETAVVLKGNDVLNKPLPVLSKIKQLSDTEKSSENSESSSISSGDSIPDRDSDSDYKETRERPSLRSVRRNKVKPRILKVTPSKGGKFDSKVSKLKPTKQPLRKDTREKTQQKNIVERKQSDSDFLLSKEVLTPEATPPVAEVSKIVTKQTPKSVKKEKRTPSHVTALLSDMTSLFSTPDVIRRVSTDGKTPGKPEKESAVEKKQVSLLKIQEPVDSSIKTKTAQQKTYSKQKDKIVPLENLIPQLDDASLAQILQDTTSIATNASKIQPNPTTIVSTLNSPGLAGPLSPTLDLLGGIQPDEDGLSEDLLMHVAHLVESSENLQEVIDKLPANGAKPVQQATAFGPQPSLPPPEYTPPLRAPSKAPIEIVRRDGRVITLPPIEAPATRSSKRKSQQEGAAPPPASAPPPAPAPAPAAAGAPAPVPPQPVTPEPQVMQVTKQYISRKITTKKSEATPQTPPAVVEKPVTVESQDSLTSEDDPYRLWCICKQPHNNRFMICCDGCEEWFHGKCVNITKAMGQQMEERGVEWRCPNCQRKACQLPKAAKALPQQKKLNPGLPSPPTPGLVPKDSSKTGCIVCKRAARPSSIYCSDSCILKHAQDSLGAQQSSTKGDSEPGKAQDKTKSDSRVIVYERKSGRVLAGPNAPTAENLKSWLQRNPTFEVVRPGTLHTIKPNLLKKKPQAEANKVQTTLNFARIPRKSGEQSLLRSSQTPVAKERPRPAPREERAPPPLISPPPRPSTSTAPVGPAPSLGPAEPRKRLSHTRLHSSHEKAPAVSPSTSRRKETPDAKKKMDSTEPIRENVRKSLAEQMGIRMAENKGRKFSEGEIQQFAIDTERELYELFTKDVGMKYKAKYRSLMFNIKDRKNLTLWEKICDKKITPQQLVRLSPEEMASQELAQWREEESKHQLELIKKSEIDLLAASKTYVLKTHKGEEVMETKESVQTELDPEVPVEDLVIALNDSTVGEKVTNEVMQDKPDTPNKPEPKYSSSRKRERQRERSSTRHKKSRRDSKREESKKSKSSRRRSGTKEERGEREERSTRRSSKRSSRPRSLSKERAERAKEGKDKGAGDGEWARRREHSRARPARRSKSRSASKDRASSRSKSKSRLRSRSASKGRARSPAPSKSRARSPTPSKSRARSRSRRRSSRHKKTPEIEDKQRSRSQEHTTNKSKNDSTDSEIERPKSAMLKEVHPEYDPHEPMITSAFSEEDLRKSGGEGYDDTYKGDIVGEFDTEFDPTKSFSIDSNVTLPKAQEKLSEAESDQEPSSTVENSAATVWNGCINMVDVARFYVAAHEVSGSGTDLEEDLTAELDIVGRINPDTVWEYIGKMKRAVNKDIVVLRLQAANDEEKMQYIALYSYLSSRNRLGVVKVSNTTAVKDFYIVPLAANTALPRVLLPLDGPGLGDARGHLLLAIVIRQRKKRATTTQIAKDVIPAKVVRESRKRSYTPPLLQPATTPPAPAPRLPLPAAYTSPALSTSVKDKIAASLAAADDEEAYSPGSSCSTGSGGAAPPADKLRSKMEELNRQIEEQKQQILKMAQADSSSAPAGEDEAYSPSRPMTPPAVVPLADIALPSNLHEILATIKQRSETNTDVDMRNLPLPP